LQKGDIMSKYQNATITIKHIATGLQVEISGYLFTEFQDTIDTQYNAVQTFGRMDPIVNYQGSSRKISLGIKRIDQDDAGRIVTHQFISRLQKMQYPVYERGANALTIQRPPIVAVSLGNLIRGGDGGPLICAMNGFAFTPTVGFTPEDSPYVRFGAPRGTAEDGVDFASKDTLSFKSYSFKFDFTVLHRSPVGFQQFAESDPAEVTDPDEYGTKGMKFLGGYYFGSQIDEEDGYGSVGEIQKAKVFSSDTDNNVQTLADAQKLLGALDTRLSEAVNGGNGSE